LSGKTRVGWYQKKHSPTHTHHDHLPPFTTIHSILCSFYVLDNPLGQPLSRSSLVFPLVLDPQLHNPYFSSPNHHHLFAAHAHTNAACSTAKPMLCHLYLVSLSAPYLGVCLLVNATHPPDHSHLCSLKCHHVFFPYRPGLTSMQNAASHTNYYITFLS